MAAAAMAGASLSRSLALSPPAAPPLLPIRAPSDGVCVPKESALGRMAPPGKPPLLSFRSPALAPSCALWDAVRGPGPPRVARDRGRTSSEIGGGFRVRRDSLGGSESSGRNRPAVSSLMNETKGLNRPQLTPIVEKSMFLNGWGIDSNHPAYPQLIHHPVSKFNKILQFLRSYELEESLLPRLVTAFPILLTFQDLEESLAPTLKFLVSEVGIEDPARLSRTLHRCPKILVLDLEEQLRPTFRFLNDLFGEAKISKYILSNPHLLVRDIQQNLLPRILFLESCGIPKEDVQRMVQRCPSIFNYSVENNLKPKMDFLRNEMKRDVKEVVDFPQFFAYSLENKIKPRFDAIRETRERHNNLTLLSMLTSKEDKSDGDGGQ